MLHEVSFASYNGRDQVQGMDLCSGLQTEGNRPGDPRIWGTFQTLSAHDICLHGCGLYRGSRRSCRTWEDSNGQ